jgi:hypothetical protein
MDDNHETAVTNKNAEGQNQPRNGADKVVRTIGKYHLRTEMPTRSQS